MKTKLTIILLSVLWFSVNELYSQEPCKVLKQEIAEKYVGKCKNGFAHGKGVAEGKDKYEGEFKNGLPHGNGKYTFATGEIYEGKWKEGKKEGEGKYFYKKNGTDSVKVGFWGNDVFIRNMVLSPYKVVKNTNINRFSVRKVKEGNRVLFSFKQNGGTNSSVSGLLFANSSGREYTIGSDIGYEDVVFPFTCKLQYSSLNSFKTSNNFCEFAIEINESGDWEIILNN